MKNKNLAVKCLHGLGVAGLLGASAEASADISYTDLYIQENYVQTGGSTIVDLMSSPLAGLGPIAGGNLKVSFQVATTSPSDFTSITVSGNGLASPQALGAPTLQNGVYVSKYTDPGFANLAALDAKYPLGSTFQFSETASNPALSQGTTDTYGANHQPTTTAGGSVVAVPELSAASYASLQGLAVSSADTLDINAPFYGDGATRLEFEIFNVNTLATVYQTGYEPATTASLLVPAGTLSANTEYIYSLGYENTYSGCASTGGGCSDLDFENFTFGEFTTAAASTSVPEPATLSLLGLGLVGVGFVRRRKSA